MFEYVSSLVSPPPRISTAGWAVVGLLVCYLVGVEPWLGRATYQRLARDRDSDPRAFVRLYRLWLAILWSWLLGVALVLVLSPGLYPAHIGLAWPHGDAVRPVIGFFAYLVAVVLVVGVVMRIRARRGGSVPGQGLFIALLPRTRTERWYALAMALSAGICEELLTRGLLIAAGIAVGLSPYVSAAAATAIFGLAHLYQGVAGVLGTALVGALLATGYLATGSLLIPVIVHIVLDLRALVLMPPPADTASR